MKTLFTTLLFIIVIGSTGQMNLEWLNDTELNASSAAIKQGPDGNLYFITKDEFGGTGSNNLNFIQKISQEGELIWQFGENDFSDGQDSQYIDFDIDSENNVYIVGTQSDNMDVFPRTEIIKINPSGNEVWRLSLNDNNDISEAINHIEITSDDRIYLIARLDGNQSLIELDTDGNTIFLNENSNYELPNGFLYTTSSDEIFVFDDDRLTRINNNGQEIFSFTFAAPELEYYFNILYDLYTVTNDEDYLYFTQTCPGYGATPNALFFTKMSLDGSEITQELIVPFPEITNMDSFNPYFTYVDANQEIYICGNYYVGEENNPNSPTVDDHLDSAAHIRGGKGGNSLIPMEFVIKLNSDLSLAWSKSFDYMAQDNNVLPAGGFFHGNNFVYQTSIQDGEIVLAYFTAHDDLTGDIVWTYTQQPNELFNTFRPYSLITGDDQAIYAFGRGDLLINDQIQYQSNYVSKYLLEDFVNVAEQENQTFRLYPNPANNFINIESKSSTNHFVIYDSTGRIVLQKTEFTPNFRIDINTLAPGVYVFNLNGETRKILVE
jgi:hypothetical protein